MRKRASIHVEKLNKGAFNNYVDKERGRGGQPKVHTCLPGGGWVISFVRSKRASALRAHAMPRPRGAWRTWRS